MLLDMQDYDGAKTALEQGNLIEQGDLIEQGYQELVPSEIVYAILDGGNAIKVWREFRGMSQQELAEKTGISTPYLSQLETNKRTGSIEVLSSLANVLQVSLDNIIPAKG